MLEIVENNTDIQNIELPEVKEISSDYKKSLIQNISKLDFVLLSDEYEMLHQPVMCKDYFNEIIMTELDNQVRTQYGFVTKKFTVDILSQKSFKMGIRGSAKYLKLIDENPDYLNKIVNLLNKIEINKGYVLTTIEEAKYGTLVLTSDIRWINKAPVYFGLYCFLIRLAYNWKEKYDFADYLNNIFPSINSNEKISSGEHYSYNGAQKFIIYLFNGGKVNQKWNDYLNVKCDATIHERLGIMSYFYDIYEQNLEKLIEDVKNKEEKVNSI